MVCLLPVDGEIMVISVRPPIFIISVFYSCILATAVIMSITGAAPFNGEKDQDLAVAYISALILYYMVSKILTKKSPPDNTSSLRSFRWGETG